MNAVGGILCSCVHSGLPLDWPSPPHCLLLLHGMRLQQCYLVHLHAACACACIVAVKPAAAAFLELRQLQTACCILHLVYLQLNL